MHNTVTVQCFSYLIKNKKIEEENVKIFYKKRPNV